MLSQPCYDLFDEYALANDLLYVCANRRQIIGVDLQRSFVYLEGVGIVHASNSFVLFMTSACCCGGN